MMKISDRYHNMTFKTKVILWLLVSFTVLSASAAGAYLLVTNAPRYNPVTPADNSSQAVTAPDLFKEGETLEHDNKPEQALDKYKAARDAYQKDNDENGVASSLLKIQIAESMIKTNQQQKSMSQSDNPDIIVEPQSSN